MALGRRSARRREKLLVPTRRVAHGPGHRFYAKVNEELAAAGFDAFGTPTSVTKPNPLAMPKGELISRGIIAVGLVGTPAVFLLASKSSQPSWDWDTSVFGRLAWPLVSVMFASVVAASACIPKRPGTRIAVGLVAAVMFIGLILGCVILCALLFGTPFH